jgi:hypothetical protein
MKIVLVALHLQKNVTFFYSPNFYPKCLSGCSGPATLAKKYLALAVWLEILFYRAGMCACRDERNEALAGTLYRLHKSSIVSTQSDGERLLNIIALYNPQLHKRQTAAPRGVI